MLEKYKYNTIALFWYAQLTKELGISIATLRNWTKFNNFPNQLPNFGRIIERGKDYDASTHLRPFPNMLGNYKYGILE